MSDRATMVPFVRTKEPSIPDKAPANLPTIAIYIPFVGNKRFSKGFTLIELMITLVIAVILLTVGSPLFTDTLRRSRLSSEVNEFLADLNFARSEAIKRASNIGICSGTPGTGCTAGGWQIGRIIFADADGDGVWDNGEPVIRSKSPGEYNNTITGPDLNVFSASGGLVAGGGIYAFCYNNNIAQGKQVTLNNRGQAFARKNPPASC